jgi:hypothetical protein
MEALKPEEFLKALDDRREAAWVKMTADRKSYGAEKPLTREVILRRLQFGVVMERRAGEVTARWVNQVPDLDIQRPLSEYVANELKHAAILRDRIKELDGDPDALWSAPLPELKELWDYHASLGTFCELLASVQYGHEEFFPRTSKSFIERVEPIDPKTAAIYRDTLLGDEEGHEWLAPEALKRYASDPVTQKRCLDALGRGCELFARAIQSFNRAHPA